MARFSDLESLLNHIWTYVETGAHDRSHPFYTPTLATALAAPNLRTVVLRKASRADRMLAFHSDRRSQKIGEIRGNERIAWHHWNADTAEQLRLKGTATVHTDDGVADALWADATPRQRAIYVKPTAPNTPVDAPASGIAPNVQEADTPSQDDVRNGRRYFAAVRTVIDEITWLHLHPEGHYRARFRWTDSAWQGSWVIP